MGRRIDREACPAVIPGASNRTRRVLWGALFLMVSLSAGFGPGARPLDAQADRRWITETTVTFGRSGPAYQGNLLSTAVAVGDLGARWDLASGAGWGVSGAGGYDFPNEAVLVGARVRWSRRWGPRRLEGTVSGFYSSLDQGNLGSTVGVAFYPHPWGAVVAQLEFMPTFPREEWDSPDVNHGPALSLGIRASERLGLASWGGAAVLAVVALIFAQALDGGPLCC